MKTGYFPDLRNNKEIGAISIAIGNPQYIRHLPRYTKLAPLWDFLMQHKNKEIDDDGYITEFNKILDKLNPQEVYDELININPNPVLMCFCKPDKFCHRHIVAKWLEDNLGIEIEEYSIGKVKREKGIII